jgi:type II secretory pathway pseudopilin PulG
VELLIVIGLLGAIALIVIAAINPIEQANRARDTRFKADGGQLISAIDRYFAANTEFPWMTVTSTYDAYDAIGFVTASDQEIGICGATCTADGVLITSSELKTEFRNRDFIQNGGAGATVDEQILIGKETGSSASVYACYVPMANSTKKLAVEKSQVFQPSTSTGSRGSPVSTCDGASGDGSGVDWVANGCYVCIPE